MLDFLIHLVSRLGNWGYMVIFVSAMLESAIFFGFVIPGQTLALVAGFLTTRGVFQLELVILIVAIGAALGDSIGYEIGGRLGRPALTHFGARFGLSAVRVNRADAFF